MVLKYAFILYLGILVTSCTLIPNSQLNKSDSSLQTEKYKYADIFTYEFDPSHPQIDMSVSGKLVIQQDCLLIVSETGGFSTPVFPEGVSYWDKDKNIIYINDKGFAIGTTIHTNGSYFNYHPNAQFDPFISKAHPSCLRDSRLIIGTKFN